MSYLPKGFLAICLLSSLTVAQLAAGADSTLLAEGEISDSRNAPGLEIMPTGPLSATGQGRDEEEDYIIGPADELEIEIFQLESDAENIGALTAHPMTIGGGNKRPVGQHFNIMVL